MKYLIAPLLMLLAGLAPPMANASGQGDDSASDSPPAAQALQNQIQSVIQERHPTDTPDWWKGLGPQAPAVIMSMYQSSSHIYQRIRLVEGLGWFDDSTATQFLKEQAQNATDDVIRNASITSIAISQGAKEEDFIANFLQSDDPETRYTAASALKRIGDARSRELLTGYLSTEKLAWLRDKVIHQQVTQPVGPLRIATHAERRLNAAFDGHWTGFWVEPSRGSASASGMKSDPATLDLTLRNGTDLSGELRIHHPKPAPAGADASVRYSLQRIVGRDTRVSGIFSRTLADATGKGPARREQVSFDAELVQKDGITVLHFVMPEALGTMIVRRDAGK